jgi:hypothetical protein
MVILFTTRSEQNLTIGISPNSMALMEVARDLTCLLQREFHKTLGRDWLGPT